MNDIRGHMLKMTIGENLMPVVEIMIIAQKHQCPHRNTQQDQGSGSTMQIVVFQGEAESDNTCSSAL
eukprot:12880909-Prorocentrum_lima.AAC.1